MTSKYELEKKIWTEDDFPIMGWHDAPVYSMLFQSNDSSLSNQLLFDLDYIFQWINPSSQENHFSFWIAPVTLLFKNVINLNMEISRISKPR